MPPAARSVTVEGRRLRLTSLTKVLYPTTGFTKAHLVAYVRDVAPVLLPHLAGRAVTLKRYPEGVDAPHFYQKACPEHRPAWVRTASIWSRTREAPIEYCLLDDLPSLVWAANLANVELHTFLAKAAAPDRPTALVLDLDPGPGADLVDCCDTALWLREVFDAVHLRLFPKTSGQKGLQLYAPIRGATFEATKAFARAAGEVLAREHPARVTTNMSKAARPRKVFVDWSQNDAHKTTVCVYSLRATDRPSVSTPLAWDEVERAARERDAAKLRFGPDDVLLRIAQRGDPFAPVLDLDQRLPPP